MWNFKKDIFRVSNDNGIAVELCYDDIAYSGACIDCGQIIFNPFDSMVVRFIYEKPQNGTDLDIMVYYDGTGSPQDLNAVGYNQLPDSIRTPFDSTPDADAYLWWATDDVGTTGGTCVEAVVIGVENLLDNVSVVDDYVDVLLRVGWFNSIGTSPLSGMVNVELVTYSGGVMSLSGTNIINTGGVVVDNQNTTMYVPFSGGGQVSLAHSTLAGTVRYNKITKSAVLIT